MEKFDSLDESSHSRKLLHGKIIQTKYIK